MLTRAVPGAASSFDGLRMRKAEESTQSLTLSLSKGEAACSGTDRLSAACVPPPPKTALNHR